MVSIEVRCGRCRALFWTKLVRGKNTGSKVPKKVFCTKCRNRMNVSVDRKRKEDINVRLISDKVNCAHEVEALRRMEVHNPVLVERLRRESGEKKAAQK